MGRILAIFQSEGKIFEEMDVLKIQQSDSAINGAARFTRRQGILSSPVALLMGRFFNSLRTFDKETGSNWNEQVTGSKKVLKDFYGFAVRACISLYRINIIVSLSIFRHNFVYCFPDLLGIELLEFIQTIFNFKMYDDLYFSCITDKLSKTGFVNSCFLF